MDTIIYVSPHVDQYGAEKSMIANIKNIKKHGINVLLIIPTSGRIESLLNEYNIEYVIEKFYDVINHENKTRVHYGLGKGLVNTYKAFRISNYIKKKNINPILVHSNSLTSDFGIVLSEFLKIPHIQHIRELGEYDFGMTFDMGIEHFSKVVGRSSKIICISDAVYNYYRQYMPESKMIRIYNGVDVGINQARAEQEYFEPIVDKLKLVLVGRLSEEKGQIQAIRAIEKLKKNIPVHLDLWGDGVDREKLQLYIQKNNLDEDITLCGYSENIPYQKYQIALVCSKYEAFGRVTVEYMFNELPVIGVNSGGTKEIIQNNITGLLYEDENIDELVASILKLALNKEYREKLGKAGLKRAQEEFSEVAYCEKVYRVYKQICPKLKE